ncbi:hypothetical protein FHS25_004282 [Rhizobium laguerreae]|uniref:Uncharacterized protein n=1 Tax=Rhizobium laguerreae TaxID=1076926 RepID=A0ABR6GEL3_9HYPH|nr:hypothetical protein [Rhizobium laguerreae]MBB3163787.1 hypothetical protein [Rhizobium laguerreae]
MPIDNARSAPMQPGVPVEELKAALGTSWKEPSLQAEGHLNIFTHDSEVSRLK